MVKLIEAAVIQDPVNQVVCPELCVNQVQCPIKQSKVQLTKLIEATISVWYRDQEI